LSTPTTQELVQICTEEVDAPAFAPPVATPPEILWRHAGWNKRRDKIRSQLGLATGSASRCERWDNCGGCAVVEYSTARKRHRVTCWHCRDRWCQPCQVAKRCELVKIVNAQPPQERFRFLTTTLRHDDTPLRQKITQLKTAFRKLTRSKWWKANVVGGVCTIEVKLSDNGKWHPHLHLIVDAAWLDKGVFREEWRKASGGSFIVDVRDVKNPEHAAGYIAKYLTKGVDASVLNDPEKLREAIIAMRGMRAFDVFGAWRGERMKAAKAAARIDPDESNCSDFIIDDWKPIETLRSWLAALSRADPWAVAIQRSMQAVKQKKGPPT
jgi:hypothetical protein